MSLPKVSLVTGTQPNFTSTLWGLDWNKYFPLNFPGSNLKVEVSSLEEINSFISKNSNIVYGTDITRISFLVLDQSPARATYYQEMGDFFAFKDGEKIIGIFVSNPLDWATYYWRSVALLPEYQGNRIYQTFLNHILSCLTEHQVRRIEADIAPSNFKSIHVLNKLEFHITGINASERWGTQVHFTKFLSSKHKNAFEQQFCCGVFASQTKQR